jgi:hypothetical protein
LTILEVAAGNQVHYTYAESEAKQFAAMAEMTQKHKVLIKRWADEDLAAIEKAWLDVLQDESGKDRCSRRSPTTTSHFGRATPSGARHRR